MAHRLQLSTRPIAIDNSSVEGALFAPDDAQTRRATNQLEPGLLPAFRLLMALPIVIGTLAILGKLITFVVAPNFTFKHDLPVVPMLTFMSMQAITLGYLYWPGLPARIGRYFLPIGLALATAGESAMFSMMVFGPYESSQYRDLLLSDRSLYFLVIPLVLISWQYNYRRAIRYTIALAVFELTLLATLIYQGESGAWIGIEGAIQRTVVFLVIGYLVTSVISSQRRQRQALTHANTQLRQYTTTLEQLAVSRERNRLARELHDTLAHHMSGMVLQLEGTKLLWDRDLPKAKSTLEDSIATARAGLTETRRALQSLRASPLEDLGLQEAMRTLVSNMAERSALPFELDVPDDSLQLSPAVEQAVYRITQEALTNVERHAGAASIRVGITEKKHEITLTIMDDGRGFTPTRIDGDEHFGLQGMRERAEMVGGSLHVESNLGVGTSVEFTVMV